MCTLFSTMLAAPAANGRFYTDFFCCLRIVSRDRPDQLRRSVLIMQFVYIFATILVFLFMPSQPEQLVVANHYIIGLFGTPVAIVAICWMVFQTDVRLRMEPLTAIVLSSLSLSSSSAWASDSQSNADGLR